MTVKEVRKALQCDRVGLFRFDPDSNYCYGQFVAESVLPVYDSVLLKKVKGYFFGEEYTIDYQHGSIQVLTDIYNASLKNSHIQLLEEFQIRAQIIVPLMNGSKLWGLIYIHQCENTRKWSENEILFVKQLAAQFNVALQHCHLLAQTHYQHNQDAPIYYDLIQGIF